MTARLPYLNLESYVILHDEHDPDYPLLREVYPPRKLYRRAPRRLLRTSQAPLHRQEVQHERQGLPLATAPPPLQNPGQHHGQFQGGMDGTFATWSAWDEEYDNPIEPQPQALSQPPPLQPPTVPSSSTFRLGYANSYDPATDPWHEEGQLGSDEIPHNPMAPYLANNNNFDLRPQRLPQNLQTQTPQPHHQGLAQHHIQQGPLQPPTMDSWHNLAQDLANTGPLLPPQQWAHNNAPEAVAHMASPNHAHDQELDEVQQLPPRSPPPAECAAEDCAAQPPEQTAHWPDAQGVPPPPERDLQPLQADEP